MAKIKVDLERVIGNVDRRIFGGFVEHLGRCIYGGIYEEGSPLSDENGFRRDVLAAAGALRMPVLRWPGGNFVSGYHWTDGIGPKEQRPRRIELAWRSEESNLFGTDEFMAYCRVLGVEPYLCVNMGTGTMDEAQAWVEYCNGTGNTHWANLRRQNGHLEPYNVKYWGLGNEMWGPWQIGALGAADYANKAIQFAKVMKWTDPTIQLISCGKDGLSAWDSAVLEVLAPYVDFHSIHIYTGSSDYHSNVFAPHQAERALRITEGIIERVRYEQKIQHPIHVAYDEWNVWYRMRGAATRLEEQYTLADALAVATYLNVFIRHCRAVKLANLAQLVNVIAPIFTNPEGLFLQTIYHPLRLYGEHVRDLALDVLVDCETYDLRPEAETSPREHRVADMGPFNLLDVSATRDAEGQEVVLSVVNRDRERAIETSVELAGGLEAELVAAYEVNGAGPDVVNSFAAPEAVAVRESHPSLRGQSLRYSFPAHSLTLLRLNIRR